MTGMKNPAIGEPELGAMCRIAERAAAEVMAVYAGDIGAWSKDDSSPLTHADLRSDAAIRQGLQEAFPGVFILSEESTSEGTGEREIFFLVDPLDGTKEFISRNGEFTVNIALVNRGEPVAGVVVAPAPGEMFFAARGLGAWKKDGGGTSPIHVRPCDTGQPLRVIGSRSHGGEALAGWLARLQCEYRFVAAGSSLKFCRIAEGEADVYPRMGPTSQWDTAAGQAVLAEAGGAVLDAQGQPLAYGLQRPVLNPNFVALADRGIVIAGLTRNP
jgi:3'(2'),5'-bisphosphate nucleotidase